MPAKRKESKQNIPKLTNANANINLLLLVIGLLAWTGGIYDSCKKIDNDNNTEVVNATELALASSVLLSCLGAVAILGILNITKPFNLEKNDSIFKLLGSILGFIIFISIGLIVVGSISAHAISKLDNNTIYTSLTIIAFLGGFIPLLTIMLVFFLQRYLL